MIKNRFRDKKELLQMVQNADDKILLAKILDDVFLCLQRGVPAYSDFLDPYRMRFFKDLLEKSYGSDITVCHYGGYGDCERSVIGVFSKGQAVEWSHFPVSTALISSHVKFGQVLSHRDYLGALMGLGLDRSKFGDIIIRGHEAYVFIKREIWDYVHISLEKIGRNPVKVQAVETGVFDFVEQQEKRITVASLRLDVVVSNVFKISRSQALDHIRAGKVFHNWQEVDSASKNISAGDQVTLRGSGRVKIIEILGLSRKNKIVLKVVVN